MISVVIVFYFDITIHLNNTMVSFISILQTAKMVYGNKHKESKSAGLETDWSELKRSGFVELREFECANSVYVYLYIWV